MNQTSFGPTQPSAKNSDMYNNNNNKEQTEEPICSSSSSSQTKISKPKQTDDMEIRYGFIAEYGGARYRIILLDPIEELLLAPFKGAELGRWYRIEMNGAQSPKITGRITDIFETRPAASGSAKNGPYQILIPVMNADLPKQFSLNGEDKKEFYSPALQTNGRLLRFQDEDEEQFQHGKLYSAYVTISSFNNPAPVENLELEHKQHNSINWTLERCDITGDWDLSSHTPGLLELLPRIHTEIERIWYGLVGVSEMEELNFPDVSASQPYTPKKADKTEETSPVCGQTVFRKVPLPTKLKLSEPSSKSISACSEACTTKTVKADEALGKPNRSTSSDTDTVLVDNDVSDTDSTLSSSTDSSEKSQQIMEIAQDQQPLPTPISTGEGIVTVPTVNREPTRTRGGFGNPRRMAIDEDHFVDPPEQEATQQQQTIEPSSNSEHETEPIQSPNNDSLGENNSDTIVCNNIVITSAGASSSLAPPSSSNIKLEKEKSTSVPISDGLTDASTAIIPLNETVSNSNPSSGKAKAKKSGGKVYKTEAICRKVDSSQNIFWLMLFDLKKDVINEFRSASMSSEAVGLPLPRIASWYEIEYSYNRERAPDSENDLWIYKIQKISPRIQIRNFNGLIQFRLFARRETSQNGIDEYKTKFGPIEFDTNWPLPCDIATNKPAEFSAWCVLWWEAKPKQSAIAIAVLFRELADVLPVLEIATDESVKANKEHHAQAQHVATSAGTLPPPSNSSNMKLEKEKSTSVPITISDGMTDDSKVMHSCDETAPNSLPVKSLNSKGNGCVYYGKRYTTEAICRRVDASQNVFWLMLFNKKDDVINEFRTASMWSDVAELPLPIVASWYEVEYSYNRERTNNNDNQIWIHKMREMTPRIPIRTFNGLIQFHLSARREASQNDTDEYVYRTKFGPLEGLPSDIVVDKPAELNIWCALFWKQNAKQNGIAITVHFRELAAVQPAHQEITKDESVNADKAHHSCEQPLVGSSSKSEQGERSILECLREGITSNFIESEAVTNAINDTKLNITMTADYINTEYDYAGPTEHNQNQQNPTPQQGLRLKKTSRPAESKTADQQNPKPVESNFSIKKLLKRIIGVGSKKIFDNVDADRIEVGLDCTELLKEMSSMTVKEPISISKVPTPQSRRQDGSKSNASTSDKQSNVHEYRLKVENASSEHLNSDLPNHAESNGLVVQSTEITLNNNDRTILPEVQSPKSLSLSSNIPEPQQKTAQSVEASETETEHSTTETASNDGSSTNAADLQNQNGACSGVKGKCDPDEYKAFAFCWYKNNVDIFLVLYNKKAIIGYKQAAMNCLPTDSKIQLGVWYKIHYLKYRSVNSIHIRINKLADIRPVRLAQLPSIRMSSDGGNHVEICIDNWYRLGRSMYRNELGDLLIADTKVNEILATAIDKWKAYSIWCQITKGRQLEFVDYELRGGNLDHYASVNGNKLQLDHGNCSSALAEPKPPAVVLSNNNLAKTKSSDVDGNCVSKSLATNGVQHQPQMSSKLSIGIHNGSISAIIEKDVMVLCRQNEMDAFFVIFDTQKKCFTKFNIAAKSSGAMTDAFAGLRIGQWYTVNYRNYAKTGEHIWVSQILETDEHLSTRVHDSVEFCLQCYRVDGGSYSSSSLGEFSSTSGAVGNGQLPINGTRNDCFGNETEEKLFAWFKLVAMGKFAFVEPDKGNGFSPTTNVK